MQIDLQCQSCHKPLSMDSETPIAFCPFCGAQLSGNRLKPARNGGPNLLLERNMLLGGGTGVGIGRKITVKLNGEKWGKIAYGATDEYTLAPGQYTIQFTMDWLKSDILQFTVKPGMPKVIVACEVGSFGIQAYFK